MSQLEQLCANSYRNFHVKGFDYLCLKRTPTHTRKVYFFGNNLAGNPELVIPHDHRYSFKTKVLSGQVTNKTYTAVGRNQKLATGLHVDHFLYATPLNGGAGFEWAQEAYLNPLSSTLYGRGSSWLSAHNAIHTLQIPYPNTVILLDQYEDVVPDSMPTNAYRLVGSREPPNLDGLYDRMDEDYAAQLLVKLAELII
jgi:hypothetical protein